MIKVFIDDKPLSTGHAIRGVGSYTRNLIQSLEASRKVKLVSSIDEAQVVHYPYFDLFFNTLHLPKNKPIVITIFDTIPLIYPSEYPPGLHGRFNFLRQKKALAKVDAVITISETSKKDIVRFLDVPSAKIFPIHLAASRTFKRLAAKDWAPELRSKYKLPEKFVLYVGDVNFNKNLVRLAKACKLAKVPLVIVGKQALDSSFDPHHPENQELRRLIEEFGKSPDVLRVGYVPEEDLIKMYNLATVYCQPSLYEGFGLPVLEAMACGVPVVASKIQVHTEIAWEAVYFVDPKRVESLALGIEKVCKDIALGQELVRRGLLTTKRFLWSRVVDETVQVYQKISS